MGKTTISAVLLFLFISALPAANSAKLIHLTMDGNAGSAALYPGFNNESCWSGIGAASNGNIYVTGSNHDRPGGNVAFYKYDPSMDKISLIGNAKSVSQAAGNWMTNESQYKVHTFVLEHADGKMYCATMDHAANASYENTYLRGSHLYSINTATDEIMDESADMPYVLDVNFNKLANGTTPSKTSGVWVGIHGMKGIMLNPNAPDLIYGMTIREYPFENEGHIIRYDKSSGDIKRITTVSATNWSTPPYVMAVSNDGDLYYIDFADWKFNLKKYDNGTGQITTVKANFADVWHEGSKIRGDQFGMVAYSQDRETIYLMTNHGWNYGGAEIWKLTPADDSFTYVTTLDTDYLYVWQIFTMNLTPDDKEMYFVNIGNDSLKNLVKLDLGTLDQSIVMDLDVVGDRGLTFGGVGCWDTDANLYSPVWKFGGENTLALLKIEIDGVNNINDRQVFRKGRYHGVNVFPNPVRPGKAAAISVVPEHAGKLQIVISDFTGRVVRAFSHPNEGVAPRQFYWDGKDGFGQRVKAGLYSLSVDGRAAGTVMVVK